MRARVRVFVRRPGEQTGQALAVIVVGKNDVTPW